MHTLHYPQVQTDENAGRTCKPATLGDEQEQQDCSAACQLSIHKRKTTQVWSNNSMCGFKYGFGLREQASKGLL